MNLLRGCLATAALCLQLGPALGLFDGTNDVEVFDGAEDFRARVLDSDAVWLVQFYDPGSGPCQQFAPIYAQVASLTKGIAPLGAVDAATDGPQQRIAAEAGVRTYPALKIFAGDKTAPIDVKSRDPNAMVHEIFQAIQDTIQGRVNHMTGRGGGDKKSSRSGKTAVSKVVQLTASNFSEKVYHNADVVLVAFAAPWCGHCKNLLPEWEEASAKLDGMGATLGWVDATVEESLAQEYGVMSFPTIKVFPGGAGKSSGAAVDYSGGRQASGIVEAALEEVDRSGAPQEIPELTSAEVLRERCEGAGQICVVYALPHILDTGADGRNRYRDVMAAASRAVRGMNFVSLWFEGGAQPALEAALELTSGTPAVAAYAVDKGAFAVHRGSFTEANIRRFLTGITTGRQGTYKLSQVPTVETVEPWDGEDGVPIEEESLADIMGWDDDEEPEL